jgi:kynureninase
VTLHDDLLARRGDYPVLDRRTYLASHTLGAMHRRTPSGCRVHAALGRARRRRVGGLGERGLEGGRPGRRPHRRPAGHDRDAAERRRPARRRRRLHRLARPRNRVVTSSLEWPGSLNTWSQIGRLGGEAVVVPGSDDGIHLDVQRMVDAIDERTALVECSHVLFRTSTLVDVRPLVEKAHAVGALVMVDGYQAAGTVPVDVVDLGVDLYVGGSVKYLSGGPGNGWMYVAPHVELAAGDDRLVRHGPAVRLRPRADLRRGREALPRRHPGRAGGLRRRSRPTRR